MINEELKSYVCMPSSSQHSTTYLKEFFLAVLYPFSKRHLSPLQIILQAYKTDRERRKLTNLKIFKVLLIWSPLANANAPSVEILLLVKSKSVSVLFSFSDSPNAAAPSSAKPFQDISSVCKLQFARSPFPMATPPLPRRWFQLRFRYSNPLFASIAGPRKDSITYVTGGKSKIMVVGKSYLALISVSIAGNWICALFSFRLNTLSKFTSLCYYWLLIAIFVVILIL